MTLIYLYNGCPEVLDELPTYAPSRLGVIRKNWNKQFCYSDCAKYILRPSCVPEYNWLTTVLAKTIWSPKANITCSWVNIGRYDMNEITDFILKALEKDDDGIQQFFDASSIKQMFSISKEFDQLVLAVRAICGQHETDELVLKYVESALGSG